MSGVKVLCRVRPLNAKERGTDSFLPKLSIDKISVEGREFAFDKIFRPETGQAEIYAQTAHDVVQDVLTGLNGTIMAYGQTSSGKTHSMEGDIASAEQQGILPRVAQNIFDQLTTMDNGNLKFQISVSYLEVYNEKIYDLLNLKAALSIREKDGVPYVQGATVRLVASAEEALAIVEEGRRNRQVAATGMNERSSRSHAVFVLQVIQGEKQFKKTGKLHLVDLAGSEQVKKTGTTGRNFEEAKHLNKSLSALGNVVLALANRQKHVPYRNSTLTRMLQGSLGGNTRTTILICISPASSNLGETKATLLFGERAKTINNKITINKGETPAEELRRLRTQERAQYEMKELQDHVDRKLFELQLVRKMLMKTILEQL